MSRIKDLLAEEQNIDDLKRPLYQELGELAYVKAKNWGEVRSWFRSNAEYGAGEDDEGHTEYYFENFLDLCDEACTQTLDQLIEDQHLDIDDTTYTMAIDYAKDWLADTLADFESECVADYANDQKYILDELRERKGEC